MILVISKSVRNQHRRRRHRHEYDDYVMCPLLVSRLFVSNKRTCRTLRTLFGRAINHLVHGRASEWHQSHYDITQCYVFIWGRGRPKCPCVTAYYAAFKISHMRHVGARSTARSTILIYEGLLCNKCKSFSSTRASFAELMLQTRPLFSG